MWRTKYAVALAAAIALGLWSVKAISAAGDAGQKARTSTNEVWDDGGQTPGGPDTRVAQGGPDGFRAPRDRDDDRPPPPMGKRGARGDRDGDDGRMGPPDHRDGRGVGDRGPMGPDGKKGGPGCPPEGPMGLPRDGMPPMMGPGFPHEGFKSLEKKDPELFALIKKDMEYERQTRDLARQYRDASESERTKIKELIEEVVGKHFDVRQQRRTLELKRLEQELQRLRESIDRRGKARKEIVEKRVSELTGRGDDLGF